LREQTQMLLQQQTKERHQEEKAILPSQRR
jgi:hypothetical protein